KLGVWLLDGVVIDNETILAPNPNLAFQYFEIADMRGNAEATLNLGLCYYLGDGIPLSYEKAIPYLQKAAAKGVSLAHGYLGACYEYGRGGLERSPQKAFEHYNDSY